ncbi:MAG: ChaN family lipoprotein [Candidatus Cloacimonas sp.]
MKYLILIIVILMSVMMLYANDYCIVEVKTGEMLNLPELAKKLQKYDIIFFGEYHDNETLHYLEKELLPLLETKKELIISMEMFERDVQSDLDAYVEGWLSEEEFLQKSRPWNNYLTDYRPIIEYAKAKKLSVIAANIPRPIAGKMARMGDDFMDALSEEDKKWLPAKITNPDDDYKKAFLATMEDMQSPMMKGDPEWQYKSQCLKDDTMAESIVNALEMKPKARIIHFNGDFHSRNFLGTVSRVQTMLPKKQIAVISPSSREDWKNGTLTDAEKKAGTFIILIPQQGGEQ